MASYGKLVSALLISFSPVTDGIKAIGYIYKILMISPNRSLLKFIAPIRTKTVVNGLMLAGTIDQNKPFIGLTSISLKTK
jgi:hypothetical protein